MLWKTFLTHLKSVSFVSRTYVFNDLYYCSVKNLDGKDYTISCNSAADKVAWMQALSTNIERESAVYINVFEKGWMTKAKRSGKNKTKTSGKFWFKTDGHYLLFFDRQQEHPDDLTGLKGSLDMFRAYVSDVSPDGDRLGDRDFLIMYVIYAYMSIVIYRLTTGQTFVMTAPSVTDKASWLNALKRVISQSLEAFLVQSNEMIEFPCSVWMLLLFIMH